MLGLILSMMLALTASASAQGLLWAKRAGGANSGDAATATALDSSGNVYVAGNFQGAATFGQGEANQTTLNASGNDDLFVAKYNSSGALLWARHGAAGTALDRAAGVAVDGLGNIYVTGFFQGSTTFGPGSVSPATLISAGGDDLFVAKFNSNGVLQWAQRSGGGAQDRGAGIAVDASGNSYVTGWFNGAAVFGQGQSNQRTLNSVGSDDVFVAQYNANGFLQWAVRAGDAGQDQGAGIAVDSAGNSYVTGYFNWSAVFGQGQAGQTTLNSAGDRDMFLAKYDSLGTLVWARRGGGATGQDRGFAVAVDGSANSYVTGLFVGSATFGPGQANQTNLTSSGSDDIFVAKYDTNGLLQWARRAGGPDSDGGLAVAADGFGNSYVAGFFSTTATFGPGQANVTTLASAGDRDVFVAKYDAAGALQWAKRAGGTSQEQGLAIAVDGSGNSHVTGYFFATATFGPGEAGQTSLTSAGGTDIFLAKFAGNNVVDTTAPALVISSHTNNQTTTSSPVTLSGTASDASTGGNGIFSVTVNGVAASGGTASGAGTANWSQLVTLSPGANLFTVVAKDASPNQNATTVQIVINFTPTVTISASDNTATELGPTTGMFTLTRSGGTATSLTVNYSVSGSATPGSDYFPLSGTAVFLTGQSSAQVVVTPIDDGVLAEGDESVVATLTANAAYLVGVQNSAMVTIFDNVPLVLPTITISASDDTATEQGATTGTFTVTRTGSTASDLTVIYSVTGTATAVSDYQALTGSVVIAAGQSSAPIVVTPVDDSILGEGNETVVVTLTADAAYTVGGQNNATVTIINNLTPTVTIIAADSTATEQGSTTGIFTVSRNGGTSTDLTVNYTVSGTATLGSDYQTLTGSVLIPIGQSSAQIVVTPIDDTVVGEGSETVIVTLTANGAYIVGAQNSATVTITDDDTLQGSLFWAKRAGGTSTGDAATSTAVDGSGNIYIAGNIRGTATYGLGEANETTLTSDGSDDILVARYDSAGALQWARRAGGTGLDRGAGIALDGAGNVYVTGMFQGTATFGQGQANQTTLISDGSDDLFVAKYNSSGVLQWVNRAGGFGLERATSIAVDGTGNLSITGWFNGSALFGQGQASQTLTNVGGDDIFVARYNSNGALLWAKQAGDFGQDQGAGIAVDSLGNTYVTGFFNYSAVFGQGANQTTLSSDGERDMFVAKYDTLGNLIWARRSGGAAGHDRGFAIAADGSGNSYVSGLFNGSATFGRGQANQITLNSSGLDDAFFAKYDSNGLLQWAKAAGGTGSDGGLGVAVDGFGNSYVTGFFNGITHPGPATFGQGEANQTTLTAAGDRDVFLVKLDSNGLLQWAERAGGAGTDQGLAIAVDALGVVYVVGYFGDNLLAPGSATFGEGEANETTLLSAGGTDLFVAKYDGN